MMLTVNDRDVTGLVGGMTLDSNVDTLGDQLSFSMAYALPHLKFEVNLGDQVKLIDGRVIFHGLVVTKTRGENKQEFTCFDFAFYLNKSKVIKQFNKIRADAAIKQLLAEFDVPMGYIASMPVVVTKIYYDKEVSAVIQEILEEVANASGTKYVMEMNAGCLEIYPNTERLVKAMVRVAENLPPVDCMQTISSPTKTASIEEMKNSIKLYVGGDNGVKVHAEAKNEPLIKRYGLLQETQSLEDKEIAEAKNIAQNRLRQLGKIPISAGITVLGCFDLRAGRVVEVNETMTGIVGRYKIKSASHSMGTIHTTTLDLEAI